MIMLRDPPQNPNTSSPRYYPNVKRAYHSNRPEHDTNICWALKNKIQDMIENKEIEFDSPETTNVFTAPMQKHEKGTSSIDDFLMFLL